MSESDNYVDSVIRETARILDWSVNAVLASVESSEWVGVHERCEAGENAADTALWLSEELF